MKVMVELRTSPGAHIAAMAATPAGASGVTAALSQAVPGLTIDAGFPPVQIPQVRTIAGAAPSSVAQASIFSFAPQQSTYLVRGTIPDGDAQTAALQAATSHPDVVGIFSDPLIEPSIVCPGDPGIGNSLDVARLVSAAQLRAGGMDGSGVLLAIVDTGINSAHLRARGVTAAVDVARSWTPSGVPTGPGSHPVDHGTMCAFDACIAAPNATLLDYAILQSRTPGSTLMAGLLSDAVLAYSRLRAILAGPPALQGAMVVSNSWGMYSPGWDFPPGHPGNYSDNPNHPFNVIVGSLEAASADILFAAGNCGRDCPSGKCGFGVTPSICGANSHPAVLSVGGVDISGARVGYSSQGPGRLARMKPDIMSYTHFAGSGVYPEDSGTSAACPVAAGIIAAIRSQPRTTPISPLQMQSLVKKTAQDRSTVGFDDDYGWGILDTAALLAALPP